MQQVLQQLSAVPGVVGSLVYGARGEILASQFPPLFEASALQRATRMLADDRVVLGNMMGPNASLDLRYAGGRAVVKPAGAGTLFVLCTSPMNMQLLRLSLSQASRRLVESAGAQPSPDRRPARPGPLAVELVDARERLQRALVGQIGPIGEFVFEQAWADWTASAPPTVPGLAKLVSALGREVEETDARAQFLAEARAILES
jgi:predicted regulator of Ras-like GTPase activity (Roadblock/LC7/MglB family)